MGEIRKGWGYRRLPVGEDMEKGTVMRRRWCGQEEGGEGREGERGGGMWEKICNESERWRMTGVKR